MRTRIPRTHPPMINLVSDDLAEIRGVKREDLGERFCTRAPSSVDQGQALSARSHKRPFLTSCKNCGVQPVEI